MAERDDSRSTFNTIGKQNVRDRNNRLLYGIPLFSQSRSLTKTTTTEGEDSFQVLPSLFFGDTQREAGGKSHPYYLSLDCIFFSFLFIYGRVILSGRTSGHVGTSTWITQAPPRRAPLCCSRRKTQKKERRRVLYSFRRNEIIPCTTEKEKCFVLYFFRDQTGLNWHLIMPRPWQQSWPRDCHDSPTSD